MSQNISKFSPSETDPWSWIQPCMRDESSPSQTPFLSQQLSETRSATAILRCWNCSQRTWFSCYWNVFLFDNLKTAPSPKRLQDMGSNSRHGPMLRWTTRKLCFCCCHATPADDALYLGGAWNLLDFPLASNSLWWRQSRQLFLGAQRLSQCHWSWGWQSTGLSSLSSALLSQSQEDTGFNLGQETSLPSRLPFYHFSVPQPSLPKPSLASFSITFPSKTLSVISSLLFHLVTWAIINLYKTD